MSQVMVCTDDDGNSFEVTLGSRATLRWEATTGKSAKDLNESLASVYEVAHVVAVDKKLFKGSLEDFMAQYDIEPKLDDGPKASK